VAGGEWGAASRRAPTTTFQQRMVTRARDLASGSMLDLGSRPRERTGQGPSWAGDRVLAQKQKKIEKTFQFSKPFYNNKLIWIQINFKFWMTHIHKIKYNNTYQYKRKYAAAWMQET
jgi:hypothetical protein